jgi:hypothetical protein
MSDEERREGWGVYGVWRDARTLADVEEQEGLVDRHAGRNPGMVDRSDAAIAREMLRIVGRSIEQRGGPWSAAAGAPTIGHH